MADVPDTLDDEARAITRTRSRALGVALSLGLVALVAFVWLAARERPNPYPAFGREVNGLDQTYFDRYWGCALQGAAQGSLRTDAELRAQFHRRAGQGAKRYAAHLRDECAPKLADLEAKLDSLPTPDTETRQHVRAMKDAVAELRAGVGAYVAFLDALEGPYEIDDTTALLDAVARPWVAYKRALNDVNAAVRAQPR